MANDRQKDVSAIRKYWRVCAYCSIASFAATTFGFDQGTSGGFVAMQEWLKDFGTYDQQTQLYTVKAGTLTTLYGMSLGFAIVGALASGWFGSRFGPKLGFILTAVTGIIGSGLQMVPIYGVMLLGRAFGGISLGSAGIFCISYWSETAPVKMRGMIVILYQLNINIPNLIGACVDQGTHNWSTRWAYWLPLLIQMVPPLFLLALVWLMPQSPRWLVTKDRVDEARGTIRKVRGKYFTGEELDKEIDEVVAFIELERELESSTSWIECFTGTDLRRTLIAAMCQGCQSFMGISFISGYSTYFFNLIGFSNAFLITVILNGCQVVGPFAAMVAIRFIGRRPLLIIGCGVQGFCMLAFASIAQADPNGTAAGKCIIAFICIFCFAFAATWGPVCPVVIGEIGSNRLRAKTVAIGMAVNWSVTLVVLTTLPYLLNPEYANLGTKVGFLFGGMTVVLFICVFIYLPETKDRSLEEIDEMFMNHVPPRKFKSYVCTGQAAGYDLNIGKKRMMSQVQIEQVEKV